MKSKYACCMQERDGENQRRIERGRETDGERERGERKRGEHFNVESLGKGQFLSSAQVNVICSGSF